MYGLKVFSPYACRGYPPERHGEARSAEAIYSHAVFVLHILMISAKTAHHKPALLSFYPFA